MIELDPQDEHNRKVSYIEGQLARGDRHPDDIKLLRETLTRLTKGVRKFIGRRPVPTPHPVTTIPPTPRPTAVRRSRAEEIAEQMAEAGRAAIDEHKGDDA